MILEEGKEYSKEDLIDILKVSKAQMTSHADRVYSFLEEYCDFEKILKGHHRYVKILKIKKPVEPYSAKKTREIAKRRQLASQISQEAYKEEKYMTGTQITREHLNSNIPIGYRDLYEPNSENKKDNLELLARDVRQELRKNYGTAVTPATGTNEEKIGYVESSDWCILFKTKNPKVILGYTTEYVRMTPEQENDWIDIREQAKEDYAKQQTRQAQYKALYYEGLGYVEPFLQSKIDIIQRKEKEMTYKLAMSAFKQKYGGYPLLANLYKKGEPPQEVIDRYDEFERDIQLKDGTFLNLEGGAY